MTKYKCSKCGAPITVRDYSCPRCGELTHMDEIAKVNPISLILSFLIPPVGVILYLMNNNATPTRGKKYAIAAAIGFALWIIGRLVLKIMVGSYISHWIDGLTTMV